MPQLALGHGVSAADLDFEASDLDGDKKVSAEEWDTIFFSQLAEETVENTPAPKPAPAGKPSEASLMTEEEFFHASDLNDDGKLDKKEFYGAIMDQADTFEKLSVIESKKRAAHDMDFVSLDPCPRRLLHILFACPPLPRRNTVVPTLCC